MKCKSCSKDTNNPKYCSRSCSAIHTNKTYIKRKRTKKCRLCDNLIVKNRVHCSDCLKRDRTLGELKNNGSKYRCAVNNCIRYHAKQKCRNRKQVCASCGYDLHVEVCHIKPVSSFNDSSLESEINAKNNLILLCRNCHWEQEKGLLDISELG